MKPETLRPSSVAARYDLSRRTIARRMRDDPDFPQPIRVSKRLLCWRRFKIEPPCRLNFEPGLQASLRGPAVDKCSA